MSNEETIDTLEIADLEQDIGAVSAVESAEGGNANEIIVTLFFPPK